MIKNIYQKLNIRYWNISIWRNNKHFPVVIYRRTGRSALWRQNCRSQSSCITLCIWQIITRYGRPKRERHSVSRLSPVSLGTNWINICLTLYRDCTDISSIRRRKSSRVWLAFGGQSSLLRRKPLVVLNNIYYSSILKLLNSPSFFFLITSEARKYIKNFYKIRLNKNVSTK